MFLVTEQQNMSVARSLGVCFRRATVSGQGSGFVAGELADPCHITCGWVAIWVRARVT
jgi:hypothetical protein